MRLDPPDVLIEIVSVDASYGQSLEPGLLSEYSAVISVGPLQFAAQLRLDANLLPGVVTKIPVKFADPVAALRAIRVGTDVAISDRGYRGHGLVLEVYSNMEDQQASPPLAATKDAADRMPAKEFSESRGMNYPPAPVEAYLNKKDNYYLLTLTALMWITGFIGYKNQTFGRTDYFYSFCFWSLTAAMIAGLYFYLKLAKVMWPYWEGGGIPYLSFDQESLALRGKKIPWSSVTSISIKYAMTFSGNRTAYKTYYLTVGFSRSPYRTSGLAGKIARGSGLSLRLDGLTLSIDQIVSVVKEYAAWIKLDPDKLSIQLSYWD